MPCSLRRGWHGLARLELVGLEGAALLLLLLLLGGLMAAVPVEEPPMHRAGSQHLRRDAGHGGIRDPR
jgi:hypothetical protein